MERLCAAASSANALSVAIADVDFFKRVNDRYGHIAGDAVLREVARRIRDCTTRADDLVARYGGEEFCLIAALTPLSGAVQLAETMRRAVAEKPIPLADGTELNVSISIGVASILAPAQPSEVLDAADQQLLRAKRRGKNRVCAAGYESDSAAVILEGRTHNFPRHRTAFVGRTREAELIRDALGRARCVTLVGMGGVGKTRLAQRLAVDVAAAYPDGAWFVDLTQVREHGTIVAEIGKVFGIAARDPATIYDALSSANALVVLDNCEHVIQEAARAVEEMLQRCSAIAVLCTSREALRIEGEAELAIAPMVGGDAGNAVELFVDRISSTFIGTAPAESDLETVKRICERVEGIPLALELAAAGLRRMTLEELESSLADRFATLTDGLRTASRRQQTLRGLFDWSFELLSDEERRLFTQLAVFNAGWSPEAAAAVCEHAALLPELVAKSLVVQESKKDGVRYRFLETTREYARERFESSAGRDTVVAKHAAYFTEFAFARGPYFGPLFSDAHIDVLRGEEENLHAALAWLLDHDVERALRLCKGLRAYWGITGHHAALATIERLLREERFSSAERAWLCFAHSTMVHWIKNTPYQTAFENAERALALYKDAGDRAGIAWSEFQVYRALKTLRTHAERRDAAFAVAKASFEEQNDRRGKAELLNHAGTDAMFECDFPRAEALYREALQYYRELSCDTAIIGMSSNIGLARYYQGDYAGAIAMFNEVIRELRGFGSRRQFAFAQMNLGDVLIAMGRYDQARDALLSALDTFEALGFDWGYANTASHIGRLAWSKGDAALAASLFGFAAAQFRAKGLERQPGRQTEDYLAAEAQVRSALGEAFESHWQNGERMLRSQFTDAAAAL